MLKASLLVTGYTHKFAVDVDGQEVKFEPDEERNYRAVIPYEDLVNGSGADKELLQEIAHTLETFFK